MRRQFLKKLGQSIALGALSGIARAQDSSFAPISLMASDGEPVLPEGDLQRVTYLDFWATWCGPCRYSFPWMNGLYDAWSSRGLRVVAINLDRQQDVVTRFLQQNPARFAIAMDPDAYWARRLNIQVMPTSLLIAANRKVIHMHQGFKLEDRVGLEQRIAKAVRDNNGAT